jgi:hypothetical protein
MLAQKSPHLEQIDLTHQALRVALSGGPGNVTYEQKIA